MVSNYTEPGVRVRRRRRAKAVTQVNGPVLLPVIMGEGPSILYKDATVIRGDAGALDALPFTTVVSIESIGDSLGAEDYIKGTDYKLTAPNKVEWLEDGDAPAAGATYYVNARVRPEDSFYEPKVIEDFTQLDEEYVDMFMEKEVLDDDEVVVETVINKLYLGIYLELESGAKQVLAVPIKPSGADQLPYEVDEDTDYKTALEDHLRYLDDVYDIVPMTMNETVFTQIEEHNNQYSDYEEQKERITKIGFDLSGVTVVNTIISTISTKVLEHSNPRVLTAFPNRATKKLSDGVVYELEPYFIMAAISGLKAAQPGWQSLTRAQLLNFIELKGPKLLRSHKNALAAAGITVLEQSKAGQPIVIRHGKTTALTGDKRDEEESVVQIGDYASKRLRLVADPYIGRYNMTPEVVQRIKGTLETEGGKMMEEKYFTYFNIKEIYIDSENEDQLIVVAEADVPLPVNRIEIILIL